MHTSPLSLRSHCQICGVAVEGATAPGDEWKWIDADGVSLVIEHPPGWESPTFWQDLAEHNIAEYSRLSAAYALGYGPKGHTHIADAVAGVPAPPADCCGAPMRLAPSGWRCRVSSSCDVLPFFSAAA